MIDLPEATLQLLRDLDTAREPIQALHLANAPPPGTISVGGGDWMDSFFRMEAIDGVISSLGVGLTTSVAIEDGKCRSARAVAKWNARNGYQVHCPYSTAFRWIEQLVTRLAKHVEAKQCPR